MSQPLPSKLYRSGQVRELDRIVIEEGQIPGIDLMERAGTAAFSTIQVLWPDARHITVVCGGGNNGGDGYVIARLAHQAGYKVQCLHVKPPGELKGDAKMAADRAAELGVTLAAYATPSQTDLLVDAILGTGLDRPVSGELARVIDELNALDIPLFAVDIPSGLNADTGAVMGTAIRAAASCSFIGLKQGMFTGHGPACSGRIIFSNLDAPQDLLDKIKPASRLLNFQKLIKLLPRRPADSHKGHFGHVLIVGGAPGFAGAARMAAEAAGRVGAGLVSVATATDHAPLISLARPEVMAHGISQVSDLNPLLARCNAIAVGPGLGQTDWSLGLMAKVLESSIPLIVDADALNLLAAEPSHRDHWVLTPHPGEAARLLGTTNAEIQADRFAAVRAIQEKFGGITVLKGSGTLIADRNGEIAACPAGNPGMASGGMGDVLTGVIAGLIAQGLSLVDAACLGVHLHALAGDATALDGERGMLATDLLPELRRLVNP